MKYLLLLTVCCTPLIGQAQSSVSIGIHPRLYTLLKPVRLYRFSDTLTATPFQLDSGQVVSASITSDNWKWVGISNVNVLTSERATSLATVPLLIPGEAFSEFAARLADVIVALYKPPVSRAKRHRK
jgi:hypothetical protein